MVRAPRRDTRDRGNLPDSLRHLSYELAMQVRYNRGRLPSDDNGWFAVNDLLRELRETKRMDCSPQQVETVVNESYSRDTKRFELRKDPANQMYIRAHNRDMYLNRRGSRQSYHFNTSATHGRCPSEFSDWGSYSPITGAFATNSAPSHAFCNPRNDFDGWWTSVKWGNKAQISDRTLTWEGSQCMHIQRLPDSIIYTEKDHQTVTGRMDVNGNICWTDDDVWKRISGTSQEETKPQAQSSTSMVSGVTVESQAHASTKPSDDSSAQAQAQVSASASCGVTVEPQAPATIKPSDNSSAQAQAQVSASTACCVTVEPQAPATIETSVYSSVPESSAAPEIPGDHNTPAIHMAVNHSAFEPSASTETDCNRNVSKDCGSNEASTHIGGDEKGSDVEDDPDDFNCWKDAKVRVDFDGTPYNTNEDKYLCLQVGDMIHVRPGALQVGWAYGRNLAKQTEGWFPPEYVNWSS